MFVQNLEASCNIMLEDSAM